MEDEMDYLSMELRSREVAVRELEGLVEIAATYPLMRQLNPELDEDTFRARLGRMLSEGGYRCIAAYRDGKIVGVAGFWVGTALWCGSYIEPDNVVVDRDARGHGIGAMMMNWIEREGERLRCGIVKLECYAERRRTRSFYLGVGYGELGVVMMKTLDDAAGSAISAKNGELR
jgi:GNAT superfamily N-acetyltransferase